MMIRLKNILLLTTLLVVKSATAYGEPWDREVYLGALFNYHISNWEQGFGNNAINKQAPGGSFIGGYKINNFFTIELSYDYLQSRSKKIIAKQNEQLLGRIIPSFQETHSSKYNLKGWGLSVGLCSDYFLDDLQVFASLGVANLKPKIAHTHVSTVVVPGLPEAFINTTRNLTAASRYIPKISLGFNYMLTEALGIRGVATWYNTARFNAITASNSESIAKMCNSYMFSVGILFFI